MKGQLVSLNLLVFTVAVASCRNYPQKKDNSSQQQIAMLKEASLKILPDDFRNIWLGISEEELKKSREGARFQPERNDPDERKWYREVDKTGVNVWYGIERETNRLAVIQFASSIPTWKMFNEHAELLLEKYGTDYELYQCPSGVHKFKMTRLLFPRPPVSLMEAVLESETSISVTMIVSTLQDARQAIERQRCVRIDKEAAMEEWIQEHLRREEKERSKHAGEPGGCDKEKK